MGSQRRGHDLVTEQQQRVKPKLVRSPPAAGAGVEVFNREDWKQRDFFGCLQLKTDFPGDSDGKVSAYNAGDLGSIPGSGRSSGEGNSNLLQ